MFPRVNNMIKSFKDFNEVNEFLAKNNCIVRSIDPGVTKIYVEIEDVPVRETVSIKNTKNGDPEKIMQEVINLKLVENYCGIPKYDKYRGKALVDYLKSYDNADTLLAVVIAGLNCLFREGDNLRKYLAGEEYDNYYVK